LQATRVILGGTPVERHDVAPLAACAPLCQLVGWIRRHARNVVARADGPAGPGDRAAYESTLRFAPSATAVAAIAASPTPAISRPGGSRRPTYHFAPFQTAKPSAL